MTATARRTRATVFSDALQFGYRAVVDAVVAPPVAEPEVDVFAAASALAAWHDANEDVKELTRTMRRSRKLIDTLTTGVYGGWILKWKPSTRQTPDLEAIAETYRRLGLGAVPMKDCADSISVEKVEAAG
jgi:hypothetical protein